VFLNAGRDSTAMTSKGHGNAGG